MAIQMVKICIFASNVAALVGRNRYRPREQALLETLDHQKNRSFASLQAALREDPQIRAQLDRLGGARAAQSIPAVIERSSAPAPTAREPEFRDVTRVRRELQEAEARLGGDLVEAQERSRDVDACVGNPGKAQATRDRLEQEARDKLEFSRLAKEEATLVVKSAPKGRSFMAIAKRQQANLAANRLLNSARLADEEADRKRKRAEEAQKLTTATRSEVEKLQDEAKRETVRLARAATATARLARSDDTEVAEVANRAALQRRGEIQETRVLDAAASRLGVVEQRNARNERLEGNNYVIVGRVDGVGQDGRVVESKTRQNWFKSPPEYDVIQLQVYLKMRGAASGVLEERSQSNPTLWRSTPVTCDASTWSQLDEQIERAAREISNATLETARGWAECSMLGMDWAPGFIFKSAK